MIVTYISPKHTSLTSSGVIRLLLVLSIFLGRNDFVSSFAKSNFLLATNDGARCRYLHRYQSSIRRKRWPLDLSKDPLNEDHSADNNSLNETWQPTSDNATDAKGNLIDQLFSHPFFQQKAPSPPPLQVEDTNLLFYDVFLLLTLTLAVSYCVVFRLSVDHLSSAFGEGSLISILWIISGLYHGSFLHSAVDGHFRAGDKMGGPPAACTLALHTYVSTLNLRLVVALAVAILEHRAVGASPSEQLMPLEAGVGLLFMSLWRFLHSAATPRI